MTPTVHTSPWIVVNRGHDSGTVGDRAGMSRVQARNCECYAASAAEWRAPLPRGLLRSRSRRSATLQKRLLGPRCLQLRACTRMSFAPAPRPTYHVSGQARSRWAFWGRSADASGEKSHEGSHVWPRELLVGA